MILNAADAMPQGGALSIITRMEGSEWVAVDVVDTGEGIPDDVKRRIFEPFFSTKGGSTGLGLAVSYGIIKRHGGEIECKSEPGVGTTFTLRLPIGVGQQPST